MEENTNENENEKKPTLFDHYPGRRNGKAEYDWYDRIFNLSASFEACKTICERNVAEAFTKNPVIKVLRGALKKAGCPVDLKRHIVCEECSTEVHGGYDSEYNQIIVCQNLKQARKSPEIILLHELIHMYDYCVNKVDFTDLEHLACTEIRATNLAHCSFLSSYFLGQSSLTDIKETHQFCVKLKAAKSVSVARNIDFPTAAKYVFKVFDKCYNDLEPLGRRLRRNSPDPVLAYEENKNYFDCPK